MINNQPLIKFLIWNSILFLICFIGSSNVMALETVSVFRDINLNNSGFLYTDSSSISGSIKNGSLNTVIANPSYGIIFYINKGVSIGKVYKIRINFNDYDYLSSNTSKVVTMSNELDTCNVYGYQNLNQGGSANQSKSVDIYYQCLSASNTTMVNLGQYIEGEGYKRLTTVNWRINNVQWEQLNDSQAQEIIANATTNTDNIIDNQEQNTQNIINNQNQNAEDIINNQNEIAKQQEENQKVCSFKEYNKSSIVKDNYFLNSIGNEISNIDNGLSDFISIDSSTVIKLLNGRSGGAYSCFYDSNKIILSCFAPVESLEGNISIPDNSSFFRITFNKTQNLPLYEIKTCKNGNQAITDSVNDLNDNITDSNIDDNDIGNYFDDFNDFLDDNSTITQLITLPVTLYTAILTNLNGSCSPFNLGKLYGTDLILPCINISQYLGNSLWTMIDIIISGFAIFAISKKFIKVFNNLSSLREGDVIDD